MVRLVFHDKISDCLFYFIFGGFGFSSLFWDFFAVLNVFFLYFLFLGYFPWFFLRLDFREKERGREAAQTNRRN